ncbi:hypothetical protein GCM10008111_13300 [Alishewanella tabrizica]|uniref:Uncharacterized protein n=1 Tax=Alishewanella tabrizica TaxID=671278 RepID=A0ABQ2WKJ8_9ALTE|nr:hypothetical protein GCM10008111_13300 [Alishewanella tabrizica]
MRYFVLFLVTFFSKVLYPQPCTVEMKQAMSDLTFAQIIELVEQEGEAYAQFAQMLHAINPHLDFKQDRQFYLQHSQFKRRTVHFNGDALKGVFFGLYFSGGSGGLSSDTGFGLFIGLDSKNCQLRSISYDVPF